MTGRRNFLPERGDVVKMSFDPQSGHEQAGWRPAFILSPGAYNRASSLAVFCPITSRVRGYPFEVALPPDFAITGVILVDQIRSLDWRARKASFIAHAPDAVVCEVLARLEPLIT